MSKQVPPKAPGQNTRPPGGQNRSFSEPLFSEFHKQILPYMWTVVINVGIFLAMYKHKRYTMFGHFLIGFGVALVTLLFSFPMLLKTNLPVNSSPRKTHIIVGYVIVGTISFQVILGCLCKLLNLCKVPSVVLFYMNKIHVYLGYLMTILCKFQVYYFIDHDHVFWILLGQDCLFFILTVIKKIFFSTTLECQGQPKDIQSQKLRTITTLSQLSRTQKGGQDEEKAEKENKDYCVFANYVYDLNPLKLTHPAGYQILEVVKNRQIDRFIYGMYRAQKLPNLPANSHSLKSFDLLGQPVAMISISPPFYGMPSVPFEVTIASVNSISYKTRIYQINLSCKEFLKFTGYESVQQLGRFYSLTVNNKVTRLYTSVNFLNYSNVQLLRKLGLSNIEYPENLSFFTKGLKDFELAPTTQRLSIEAKSSDLIPLLIKVYDEGTLPNLLINHKANNLILSPPKGLGLCMSELQKGTIVIIAGGTGLYPFSDLIDLLYKDYKLKQSLPPHLYRQIHKISPLLKQNAFAKFKFKLLFACQKVEDIHPITLRQICQLSSTVKFSSLIKIKQVQGLENLNLNMVSQSFEKILDSELAKIDDLARVWLCGPPKMCENISKYFDLTYPEKNVVLLV